MLSLPCQHAMWLRGGIIYLKEDHIICLQILIPSEPFLSLNDGPDIGGGPASVSQVIYLHYLGHCINRQFWVVKYSTWSTIGSQSIEWVRSEEAEQRTAITIVFIKKTLISCSMAIAIVCQPVTVQWLDFIPDLFRLSCSILILLSTLPWAEWPWGGQSLKWISFCLWRVPEKSVREISQREKAQVRAPSSSGSIILGTPASLKNLEHLSNTAAVPFVLISWTYVIPVTAQQKIRK